MTLLLNNKINLKNLFGGLHPSEIPIGAVKRRSLVIQLGGRLFKIGRIALTKAFIVQIGGLRLVYVCPEHSGYRYVANRLFPKSQSGKVDFDHALGRAIARKLQFRYVLLLAVRSEANRSHGHLERDAHLPEGISLRKHCFADERVSLKWLGITVGGRRDWEYTGPRIRSDANFPAMNSVPF